MAREAAAAVLRMEQGSGGGQTALYLDALAAFVKSTAKASDRRLRGRLARLTLAGAHTGVGEYLPPASHSQLKEALFAFDSCAWSWSDTEADIAAVLSGLPNEHALLQELNTLGEQIAACMASGNGARAPRSGSANASNLTPGVPNAWGDLAGAAGNMMQLQPMAPSLSTPFWSAASLSSPSAPYGRVSQMPQLNAGGGGGTAAVAAAAAASAAAAPPMNRLRPPLARSGASANQDMAWGLHERDLSYNIPQLTQQGHSSSGSSAHHARHGQQMQGHQGVSAQYRSASRTAAAAHSGDPVYRDMSVYPGSQHAGSHFHQQILNDVYGGDDVMDPRTAYPPVFASPAAARCRCALLLLLLLPLLLLLLPQLVASAPPAQQRMGSPTASPTHTAYRPPPQTWAYRD
ncbi:hypothetical protein JKP88DRAFT_282704 [Tribonema minus]|uniref:Uncharacterized protein n=1 Tax=Tribonema minus TaxID=303371 RepID=A0A835YJY3_9STRA|nr:hypothetical protein JKP88DRAFT_282704 [Tribonema minus]